MLLIHLQEDMEEKLILYKNLRQKQPQIPYNLTANRNHRRLTGTERVAGSCAAASSVSGFNSGCHEFR